MILQVEGHTIWQLYVMGHRHLPFMVIHRSLTFGIWKRDAIVSIHRIGGVGKIDKVLMYHLTEKGTKDSLFDVVQDAKDASSRTNKLGFPTPSICGLFNEPIWYRVGPSWRIVQTVDKVQEGAIMD
jgi:hypothetical protein